MKQQLSHLAELYHFSFLLTSRHGECALCLGDFEGFVPDVVDNPGIRIRIYDHTAGHLYVKEAGEEALSFIRNFVSLLEVWGEKSYLSNELSIYKDELEKEIQKEQYQAREEEKRDVLTGVLNKTYWENRMKVLDRAEVAPVALIEANINDWKFVYDHYGVEESDRLIHVVAQILSEQIKPEYVLGRIEGDVFGITIPMPEEGEAEEFCKKTSAILNAYEDKILAPSVAFGIAYKENVEEKILDKVSDAEYEMFNEKLKIKNMPGYKERLEKGLHL